MFNAELRNALEQTLSFQFNRQIQIYDFTSIAGGCINYTAKIETTIGDLFVKVNDPDLYPDMFEKEVKGLQLLEKTNTLKIPQIINHGVAGNFSFLILEMITSAHKSPEFWENFGSGLAEMHKTSSKQFGLDHDNYIGSLKQTNKQSKNWTSFFTEERLQRQLELARNNGHIDKSYTKKFEKLFSELDNIFPQESPSLIHGDLWNGNFIVDDNGEACIFDPAVYFGNREMELAFTYLFGGFDESFYEAYNSTYPLEPGFESRKGYYNLYPLLVHVNLFGTSYLSSVDAILSKAAYISS